MSVPQSRRRRPLPAADAIAGNEDLMTEILICLPAKSLCRFKCVSKRWNSLISHPDFSLLRKPHSVSGCFVRYCPIPSYFARKRSLPKEPLYKYVHLAGKRPRCSPFKSLTFVDDPTVVNIIDSCNGLLLISSYNGLLLISSCKYNFYVYNPTTKQFATIPPSCHLPNQYVSSRTLAFDPSRAPHYKIVFLLYSTDNHSYTYQIEMYSSETGAWRFSGDPLTTTLDFDFCKGIFFNNTIHWPDESFQTWLFFDFDQQCLATIPMPTIPGGRDKISIKWFGDSQGHLNLICGDNYTLDVLQMESDYSKWFVKYCIHIDVIKTTFPRCPLFSELSILYLVIPEVEEESSLVFYMHGMVASYNLKDKKLKKICNLAQYENWSDAHQYIETLVPI